MMNRKIRMGMIGGGPGAFIGGVHRMAAALDGQIELVAGAFSSDPKKSKAAGRELYLPEHRTYDSYVQMIEREKNLSTDERIDFVSIVTPNHAHFPAAKYALDNGFHVVCDKPMTFNLTEAKDLASLVKKTGLLFCLTHTYTGYPMVKQARHMVLNGKLGKIRKIVVEYPQGWLASRIEGSGQKQADWRTDSNRAGISCCMGDIGTHAENLAEYISGLQISELAADLTTFVPGRPLDDDGNVLLRFNNGAKGILHASQISVGDENNLNIRIYGDQGGLSWSQEEPNTLIAKWPSRPREIIRTGGADLCPATLANTRLPAGHPEGYLEAFANLYRNFSATLRACLDNTTPTPEQLDFPGANDGLRGMLFIEAVVHSSKNNAAWTKLDF
jgi:predicted dehydrogenase